MEAVEEKQGEVEQEVQMKRLEVEQLKEKER